MTEPCTLTRHSFIGWIKWVQKNRLNTVTYVVYFEHQSLQAC